MKSYFKDVKREILKVKKKRKKKGKSTSNLFFEMI